MTKSVCKRNPDRDPNKPIVKVGFIAGALPRQRFVENDFSSMRNPLKNHGRRLLPLLGGANPYAEGHNRRAGIRAARQSRIQELRDQGYTVYDPDPPASRRLYVVELDPAILEEKRPNTTYTLDPDREEFRLPPVYVGETGKSRKERLYDHKRGKNSPIHPFALNLRLDLIQPAEPLQPLEALRAERALAHRLGKAGHPVFGGH